MWHCAADPSVLIAIKAKQCQATRAFDLRSHAPLADVVVGMKTEHLLLSDGSAQIRIDLREGSFLAGAIQLAFLIADDRDAPVRIAAFQRFQAFCKHGGFEGCPARNALRAERLILQLRALDGLSAGASHREIARTLYPVLFSRSEWADPNSSLRSTVRRLIVAARRSVGGGYRRLLR